MNNIFHFFGIHKWGKWEQFVEEGITYGHIFYKIPKGVRYSMSKQRRYCSICGKYQEEII